MRLTDRMERMRAGALGEPARVAIDEQIAVGDFFDADRIVPVGPRASRRPSMDGLCEAGPVGAARPGWGRRGGHHPAADTADLVLVTNQARITADRIAVPAIKSSMQAVALAMMAERELGDPKKLDPITVSIQHPDALAALLSRRSEITAHSASPRSSARS